MGFFVDLLLLLFCLGIFYLVFLFLFVYLFGFGFFCCFWGLGVFWGAFLFFGGFWLFCFFFPENSMDVSGTEALRQGQAQWKEGLTLCLLQNILKEVLYSKTLSCSLDGSVPALC